MVAYNTVKASNALLLKSTSTKPLTAVFVGATSGIGLATLKSFAQSTSSPNAYICGRSRRAFQPHLDLLQRSNPGGNFQFITAEVSLIAEVDRVCKEILAKEDNVDSLWLSCGVLNLGGRDETVEGLHMPLALSYFSRLRFVQNLLPALKKNSAPRVVSILGGGMEKEIDVDDIEVKKDFTAMKAAQIAPTLNTSAFQALSKAHPEISFIHKYPGFVNTGSISRLLATFNSGIGSLFATIANYTLVPFANLFATTPAEAGERGLYLLTSPAYSTKAQSQTENAGIDVMQSENGVFRLDAKDDTASRSEVLAKYSKGGADEKIWQETEEVWKRCLTHA